MISQALWVYLSEAARLKHEYPEGFKFWELVRSFPRWLSNLNAGTNSLAGDQPWITFAAIRFLGKILTKDTCVFEYGVGGSTVFFARRARHVYSIEHDRIWAQKVIEAIESRGLRNCQVRLIEPTSDDFPRGKDPSDPDAYVSSDATFVGKSFKNYATAVDEYPDGYFDLILLDGRARPSCFKHAASKVRKGGFVILDNSERPHYSYIHQQMHSWNWIRHDFFGPGPHNSYFWQTCVWQRIGS